MHKIEFVKRVIKLVRYSKKEYQLEEALNIGCENLINDMISEMGEILIVAVNPDLKGLTEDYFYDTFWNNVNDAVNEEAWGEYYDALKEGAADPEYIERWS